MAGKSGTCDAIRSDSQRPSGASSTPPGWRWTRGGNPGETVKRSRPRCIPDDAGRGSSQNQDGGGTGDDLRWTIYDGRFTIYDLRATMPQGQIVHRTSTIVNRKSSIVNRRSLIPASALLSRQSRPEFLPR